MEKGVNKICLIILIIFFTNFPVAFLQTTSSPSVNITIVDEEDEIPNEQCIFASGLSVGNETRVEECCNQTMRSFHRSWGGGHLYLTTYLNTLHTWDCPQFEQECNDRLFVVNAFTGLVFDYFCNVTKFVDECFDIVNSTYKEALMRTEPMTNATKLSRVTSIAPANDSTYRNNSMINERRVLIDIINSSFLTVDELLIPCVQVALYDAEEEHFGDYVELIRFQIPSCTPTWCGIDGASIRNRMFSVWDCLTKECRGKVISIMVVLVLIAIAITFGNLSVILVYAFNPKLLHSQGAYKLSLAVADILVGLVVIPTFISSINKITSGVVTHADFINVTGYETINGTLSENLSMVEVRRTSGHFSSFFTRAYLDVCGFFTIVSFSVSIYCLTIAGFDRLIAVYRPLRYRKDKAKKLANWLCVAMWVTGVIFAIIPLFVPSFDYALVASVLVASGGNAGVLILYAIAFVLPLLVMWIVNIFTYLSTRKHARVRRNLTFDSKKKTNSIEIRLARTLSIMVGVFTLSILPAFIVTIASLFIPTIYFSRPRRLNVQAAIIFNTFEFATIVILACNSLWNFFIYSGRNLEFRKAVKVLYRKASTHLGIATCCSKFVSCAQSVVHDGRRRLSSLPTISTTAFGKKTSLIPTGTTKIKMSDLTSSSHSSQVKTSNISGINSASAGSSSINTSDAGSSSQFVSETDVNTKSNRTNKKTKKSNKNSQVSEDSVFQSFAIDANADRLFESVMDKIDEEIVEAK